MDTSSVVTLLILTCALSILVVTASLWVFTDFVMRGLGRRSRLVAVQAMRGVNETVLRSGFILLFMTNNVLLILVVIVSFITKSQIVFGLLSFLFYFAGVFLVTGVRSVPLNEKLRKISVDNEAEASVVWDQYSRSWTAWNIVRVVSGFCSVAILTVMLFVRQAG